MALMHPTHPFVHSPPTQILQGMSKPVDLRNRETLIDAVVTCLSSKVVGQNSDVLAPVAVDAVLNIINPDTAINVDLNDIRIVKQLGGTVDDTELVPGIVFEKGACLTACVRECQG